MGTVLMEFLCLHIFASLAAALTISLSTKVGAHINATLGAGPQHLVPNTHDAAVDCARDTIDHLHVKLWELESLVDTCIAHITLRGSIDHVAHLETLDCLILGYATGAVNAAHNCSVTTAMLGAAIIPALGRHLLKQTGGDTDRKVELAHLVVPSQT